MTLSSSVIKTAALLVDCPDRKGILAGIANFLYQHGGNVLHADQHQDNKPRLFFVRIEWDLKDFAVDHQSFCEEFEPIAHDFQIRWQLEFSQELPRVAVFVSWYQSRLIDQLYRHKNGARRPGPCVKVTLGASYPLLWHQDRGI